jgi:hypothetical protein
MSYLISCLVLKFNTLLVLIDPYTEQRSQRQPISISNILSNLFCVFESIPKCTTGCQCLENVNFLATILFNIFQNLV